MTPDNATEAAFVAAGGRLLRSTADGAPGRMGELWADVPQLTPPE